MCTASMSRCRMVHSDRVREEGDSTCRTVSYFLELLPNSTRQMVVGHIRGKSAARKPELGRRFPTAQAAAFRFVSSPTMRRLKQAERHAEAAPSSTGDNSSHHSSARN